MDTLLAMNGDHLASWLTNVSVFYVSVLKHFPLCLFVFFFSSFLWTSMLRYVVAFCLLALSWAQQNCQVANIQVMPNFNRTLVSWFLMS